MQKATDQGQAWGINRRDAVRMLGTTGAAGLLSLFGGFGARASAPIKHRGVDGETPDYARGMPPLKIKSVKAIATAPQGSNLVLVKVETTEPGLYGIGCATFTQRAEVVVTAINNYMSDFCVGKDVDNIEDMWQSFFVCSYWRNGPVLNNALSGLDQALWDIKGKRAGMPVYQLLGGKSRFAVDAYAHADGKTPEEAADNVQHYVEQGFRYVRIQQGGMVLCSWPSKPISRTTVSVCPRTISCFPTPMFGRYRNYSRSWGSVAGSMSICCTIRMNAFSPRI